MEGTCSIVVPLRPTSPQVHVPRVMHFPFVPGGSLFQLLSQFQTCPSILDHRLSPECPKVPIFGSIVFPTVPIPKSSVCARLIAHLSVNLGANCFLFLPRKKWRHFRPLSSRNTLSHHPLPFHSPRGESILFSFRPDVILNSAVC